MSPPDIGDIPSPDNDPFTGSFGEGIKKNKKNKTKRKKKKSKRKRKPTYKRKSVRIKENLYVKITIR